MIKATATTTDGRSILVIGLSFGNLAKFRAEPGDTHIKIDGRAMGLAMDVLIFSGETDAALGHFMTQFVGPDTKVYIDPRLKS